MLEVNDLNNSVKRRLRFIEFSLLWEKEVGRKRLQDQFEISPQQATKDLNTYIDIAPSNIFYDLRKKRYLPSEDFSPILLSPHSNEYFRFLDALVEGYRTEDEIWMASIPPFQKVSIPKREVDSQVLRDLLLAIRSQKSVEIKYVSKYSDKLKSRRISPHSFGTDGSRWHVRAYDHSKECFSDFVISRISTTQKFADRISDVSSDQAWNTIIKLRIKPDPQLNEERRNGISREYGMKDELLEIDVNQAMLFYYLRSIGFNPWPMDNGKMRNESSYQLVLENLDQVEEWLQRRS